MVVVVNLSDRRQWCLVLCLTLPCADTIGHVDDRVALGGVIEQILHLVRVALEVEELALVADA